MNPHVELSRAVRARVSACVPRNLALRLRRAARRVGVSRENIRGWTVRICDDAEIAQLHLRHMGERGPTDVLSFPAGDALPGGAAPCFGDLVLSWDAIVRQSGGSTVSDQLEEASQLCVHGLAHLLGHDHGSRAQARAMLRVERRAARAAGIRPPVRPYDHHGGGGA